MGDWEAHGNSVFDAGAGLRWPLIKTNTSQKIVHGRFRLAHEELTLVLGAMQSISCSSEVESVDLAEKPVQNAEREALFLSAIDAGKLGAWTWDIQQNKVSWSARLYEFHGLKPGDFDGTVEGFSKLIHPEDKPRVLAALENALKGKASYELEFRTIRPDGNIRWLKTAARVLYTDKGEPVRMVGGTVDLTEHKFMEQMLRSSAKHLEAMVQERTARLQETIREMESISYSIAHDMRAPLRAIQGFASLLQEECGSEISSHAGDYINRIIQGAERMDHLINDVLDYSRFASEQLPLKPINLERILESLISSDPSLQPPNALVKFSPPLPRVLGNEAALVQCFSNLLNNATKFVAPGVVPEVNIWAEIVEDQVRIFVKDNGIGIDPAYHGQLFRLFTRFTTAYQGTGIGLAIVRKAAERMHGTVGLQSEPEKGSQFWIQLYPAEIGI